MTFSGAKVTIFVVAAAFLVIGGVLTARSNKSQEKWQNKYEKKKDELEKVIADREDSENTIKEMVVTISNMYASLLRQLARECRFPEPYRFSLYDSADLDSFKLYSRYASDPTRSGLTADELTKPKNKGCLGEAWSTGRSSQVFSGHRTSYKKEHRDLGYLDDETEKFTMRPRVVFAIRFPQGLQDEYDGVLVVELQDPLSRADLDTLMGQVDLSATWGNITSAYKSLPTAIERSTSPSERGF
ncbi:hypothetical protein [Dietzia sp. UCD-THP]|uniref:hypothetical protein n=1 Tax=Dietzia sp. UCD-THP TaxID=1292020 RepID=UPI001268F06A|nr:hypothetical protein [Dietzia sp. UCD-THP]